MLWALLTAGLWSMSGICSARSGRALGIITVNRSRLAIALVGLTVFALVTGRTLQGPGMWWFILSGIVGLGMGDISMYAAYRHLGTRLTVLITQAVAVPGAWLVEWLWLGGDPQIHRAPWTVVIMVGLALALWPERRAHGALPAQPNKMRGVLFGLGSAAGLAISAVLSRRGYAATEGGILADGAILAGSAIDGLGAAALRNAGGFGMMMAIWPVQRLVIRARKKVGQATMTPDWRGAWPWLIGAAVFGPGIGVACYQLALASTPAGIVQSVVATTPVLIIPLAWLIDGDRASPRTILGAILAACGVIGMVW